MLAREEYVEQEYLFKVLRERMHMTATQELLRTIRHEILATTKLPVALEFMESSLKFTGSIAEAMSTMSHYFTPFQTFVMKEAERDDGKFDYLIALQILEKEAHCRAEKMIPQGMFLYQFEALSRNRLKYEEGLEAISRDPVFDEAWSEWILLLRRQLGLLDFAEMIFVRSDYYAVVHGEEHGKAILFGEKEGRIALANRRKDPTYLFSAFQRHLNYPTVPRPIHEESEESQVMKLRRMVDHLDSRVKMLEEELHGGLDITKYYVKDE
ncbi:MAG: hypothetical protein E7028_08990 [Planctomycetaceae bacterium]|nr:hypothetical protein [Planctomycetaceae bacterium]MBQ2822666.1 hypothetical protein [Thermoguttaceae bacterium]